jgi:asparagine synthase (glutamine-hydrolysing)
MCGLAGAVFVNRDFQPRLGRALHRLRHRGPDGTRLWSDGSAWLGHTRLRILDTTTAADQPMISQDGRGVLIYNGEVYNYRELGRELGANWRPATCSDTEVVLEMLVRQGSAALSRFNGMWALALWRPTERRLFLARDRFGIKPLYYAVLPDGGFAFASEIPALLALVDGTPEPDMDVMRRFLYFAEAEPRERTFVKGIHKLPPGCFAEVSPDGLRITPFWDLRSAVDAEELPSEPPSEYRRRFREAVLLRLRSDVAVGTCLSGGLDSSSILCTVRGVADEGAIEPTFTYKAFSARHPGTTADEGPFIDAVLAATSFQGYAVVPEPTRFSNDLAALVRHQGEPFGSLSVYAQWCVMRLAREQGVTVLLDGQGADEVLGGYSMYAYYRLGDLARRGRVVEALRLARSLSRVQGTSPLASIRPTVAGFVPEVVRRRLSVRGRPPGAARFLTGDLQRERPAPEGLPQIYPDRFRNALYASVTHQGLPSLLRYEDRNSMAFSVEARVPFLDWRVVTLGLRLPVEWKLHDGWTKWVLREALAEDLPASIRWRRDKKAFATPQAEWLKGPLREWVWEVLNSRPLRERGWFAVREIEREYRSWLEGGPAIDSELWLVLSAELWARELTGCSGPA